MKQIFSIAFLLLPFLIQAQDGTPDITFGTNGIVTTAVGSLDDDITELLVQPDGKIIASGFIYENGSDVAIAMVRYMADGTLDNTFGNGLWQRKKRQPKNLPATRSRQRKLRPTINAMKR